MRKFKFKLQKLLDIKVKDEEQSKLNYTKAQNDKKLTEKKLEKLQNDYIKYSDINSLKDIVSQNVAIHYLSTISHSMKSTNEELRLHEIKVNEAKNDFIEKQIDRKSLEKLKENKLQNFVKEQERLEQIINDEFALYAHIRKSAQAM